METSIRMMRESDLDEILAIEKSSFLSPWSRSAFEDEMRAAYAYPMVMVQRSAPFILGYLCFWIVANECRILNLAIHPDYRCQGLACRLLDRLLDICVEKKIGNCFLEVRISNQKAIALYRKLGFEEGGLHESYYADTGEDALIMNRRVSWL